MADRQVYLRIEEIASYNPVNPEPKPRPPRLYQRDCGRNHGHDDGTIPSSEVAARAVPALIYREYLDSAYHIPKPDKIVVADINEPVYYSRVPGTVVYAHPGDRLHIHVLNGDTDPHSFHLHGLSYGIDSDGAWPFGTEASDHRRSDEICPGESWTYTFDITEEMVGAWPFHDHWRDIGQYVNRGLFGGIVVKPKDHQHPPRQKLPQEIEELIEQRLKLHVGPAVVPVPPRVEALRDYLREFADFPENRPVLPRPVDETLDVPVFLHFMVGSGGTPAFTPPAPLNHGDTFPVTFGGEATYNYHCNFHPEMQGTVIVSNAATSSDVSVLIENGPPKRFNPESVSVLPGGTVRWYYPPGPPGETTQHTVTENGGGLPSFCLNGRSFVGNTPTIIAHAGQKIHWYVFNLDLGMTWHNFHPHAQRWNFADATVDVRSLSPAESFVVETIAPPVIKLPHAIEKTQKPPHRPKEAKPYKLRGDFLFHCHVEPHMMGGLAGLVRSHQTVWLTDAQRVEVEKTIGLPIDSGDNACAPVKLDRCVSIAGGKWEEVPGSPTVTMMHAALLAQTDRVLFWGYGDPGIARSGFPNTTQLWDAAGGYTLPSNQPASFNPPGNPTFSKLHSAGHAYVDDSQGTLLAHGGETLGGQQSFLFRPTGQQWALTAASAGNRFYATTMTLADGRLLTMFGYPNSIEVYDPATGTWAAPILLPSPPTIPSLDYRFYPWAYLMPGGDIFVAGHQGMSSRFSWTPAAVIRGQWPTINGDRSPGGGELGTSVLLPLRPSPTGYAVRVLIAAGSTPAAQQTAEMIDLSATTPVWMALPNLKYPRSQQCTATLLPDGRVFLAGGTSSGGVLTAGKGEIFDPQNPAAGWIETSAMAHPRGYHSSAILLTDGSVLMGGDPPDAMGNPTPHERFFPGYYFLPRPTIASVVPSLPASVGYGAGFTVNTPDAPSIAEVVLMRPGAVTHGFNQSQRYIGCAFTTAAGALTVTSPPDGNVAPPGFYMLFIVNGGRVPSVGHWVRLH
jgi:plastocyanin